MKDRSKRKPKVQGPEKFKRYFSEDPEPEFQGGKARMRLDRPGRRFGGRVGADRSPLSSAAKRCD